MSRVDVRSVWPEWEVEENPLGRGSYGVVYKAVRRDHDVESLAAIKVISIPQDESEIDSLVAEGMSRDLTRKKLTSLKKASLYTYLIQNHISLNTSIDS